MNRFSKQHIKPAITKALLFGSGIIIIAALTYWSFWKTIGDIGEIFKDGKKEGLKFFKKEIEDLEAGIRKLEIDEPVTDYTRQEIERKRRKIEDYKTYFEYKKSKQ